MTQAAKAALYFDALRRDVHKFASIRNAIDGFHVTVPCLKCGPVEAFHMRSKIPTDQIANHLKRQGWTFLNGKRAYCPEHPPVKPPRERKDYDVDHTAVPVEIETRQSASDKAKAAKRSTVLLLEDVFDVEKGCYRGGENDESVGRVVGLSAQAVQFIREEFGYTIKRPPELAAVMDEIKSITDRVETFSANNAENVTAFLNELRTLRQRVEVIARKYG